MAFTLSFLHETSRVLNRTTASEVRNTSAKIFLCGNKMKMKFEQCREVEREERDRTNIYLIAGHPRLCSTLLDF